MLNLQQQLKLQQKLSPQQIQYIKLLQLNTLALEQRIHTELQQNPMLEEVVEVEEVSPDESLGDEFDWEDLLPSGEDEFYGHKARVDREDRPERPLPSSVSLADHLRSQRAFLDFDDVETLIAEQIIGSLEADGYLRRSAASIVDDIMFTHGHALKESDVERVLAQVQQLDPPGIGARTLQECLRVQIAALPEDMPGRTAAAKILERHFEDYSMKRFARIRDRLGLSQHQLREASDVILRLNPRPGEGTISAQENYITPDFEVVRVGDAFDVSLTSEHGPRVRVSREYQDMLSQLTPEKGKASQGDAELETRQFLKRRLDSARWFMDAIQQRRQTLLSVMQAIVLKQQDFFFYGPQFLQPMILLDIAQVIDMDISTVSRVVSGKYVQCDFGVFELKYFFSEGVATQNGEMVSSKVVKSMIEGIVREEDKANPLSDRELAGLLAEKELQIARRTVSKYREQLGIPVSRLRKEIVVPA